MTGPVERIRRSYLLASVWHDDNKGDSAIAESVLELAAAAFPDADCTIASMLDRRHESYQTAFRHLSRRFPYHRIVPSPVAKPELGRGRVPELLRWLATAGAASVALALRLPSDLARAVRSSSLVIANGGHTLYSAAGPATLIRLSRVLYPYWLARRYSRPYVVFGQSLGPFEPGLGRSLIGGVLRSAELVVVREELSRTAALELGVDEARLRVVPDAAFLMRPQPTEAVVSAQRRAGLNGRTYAVVTVRQAYSKQGRESVTRAYLSEMARLIERLIDSGAVERVAIVTHCLGPVPSEDDRLPSRELKALLAREHVVLVEDDLSPAELAAFYADARWVVGTRFHSVILALVAGTPTVAVSYFGPKTHGIMKMLGLERLCFDIAGFDADEVLAAITASDTAVLRLEIEAAVAGLRQALTESASDLAAAAR
ncbi:MAG: polysaccharide pyruvyl transferase family protein [Trueperaceae bacterium]|nr:polysaccharide pyruvyl transferase family protein [Trueperaceae bacterium]